MRALVFLFSLLLAVQAQASYISLNTALSSKVQGKNLRVMVSTTNRGDESAYSVRAEIRVAGKELLAEKRPELPVNSSYQAEFSVPLAHQLPGSYPLLLILHYADANGYPFSALSVQSYTFGREAPSPVFGQAKATAFAKEGELRFTLKNMGDTELKATTRLVLPQELSVGQEQVELVLSAKSEGSAGFKLKNFSALNGSTYQLFAVTEYESGGLHYTSVAPGTVKITADESFLGLSYNLIYFLLAALVLAFIAAQFIKKK
jgi:hypothetical protein